MVIANTIVFFYRWWHGTCKFKGAGWIIKGLARGLEGLQHYPLDVPGRGRVILDLRDVGAFTWLNYVVDGRHPEEALLTLIRALARPGQVLWDVGANVGLVSALCKWEGGGFQRIESFEPNPALCQGLNEVFSGDNVVRVHAVALGETNSTSLLMRRRGDSLRSSLVDGGGDEVEVVVRTGDSMVEEASVEAPDIIKLDTEGFEVQVLSGLEKTIIAHRPALLLERSPALEAIVPRYSALGYTGCYITRDGRLTINPRNPECGHNCALIPPGVDISSLLI
jgi:FkbM family methyltransferase